MNADFVHVSAHGKINLGQQKWQTNTIWTVKEHQQTVITEENDCDYLFITISKLLLALPDSEGLPPFQVVQLQGQQLPLGCRSSSSRFSDASGRLRRLWLELQFHMCPAEGSRTQQNAGETHLGLADCFFYCSPGFGLG